MLYQIITTSLPIIQTISVSKKSGIPIYKNTELPKQQGCRILPTSDKLRSETKTLAYTDDFPKIKAFISVRKEIYQIKFRNTAKNTGFCVAHKTTDKKLTDKKQINNITAIVKNENEICCPYCHQKPVLNKTQLKKLGREQPIEFTCKCCSANLKITSQK